MTLTVKRARMLRRLWSNPFHVPIAEEIKELSNSKLVDGLHTNCTLVVSYNEFCDVLWNTLFVFSMEELNLPCKTLMTNWKHHRRSKFIPKAVFLPRR